MLEFEPPDDTEPQLERLSLCCHAAIIHVAPFNSRSLRVALEMVCTRCNSRIVAFLVVNEVGEVISRSE